MSLINDALRRAKQSQQQKPPPVPSEHLRPVETGPRRSNLVFVLPVAIVLLSAVGGILVWLALQKSGAIKHATGSEKQLGPVGEQAAPSTTIRTAETAKSVQSVLPQKVEATPASAQKAPGQNSGVVQPDPVRPHAGSSNETIPGKQTGTNGGQPAVVVTKPAVLPTLRGIYYNPSKPSAVLNKRTVFVGDSIGGFRVLAIERDSVTVTAGDRTNVLTLGE